MACHAPLPPQAWLSRPTPSKWLQSMLRELLRPRQPSPPDTPGCHLLLWLSLLWNKASQCNEFPAGKWMPLGQHGNLLIQVSVWLLQHLSIWQCLCPQCPWKVDKCIWAPLNDGEFSPPWTQNCFAYKHQQNSWWRRLESKSYLFFLNSSSPELFTSFKVL